MKLPKVQKLHSFIHSRLQLAILSNSLLTTISGSHLFSAYVCVCVLWCLPYRLILINKFTRIYILDYPLVSHIQHTLRFIYRENLIDYTRSETDII